MQNRVRSSVFNGRFDKLHSSMDSCLASRTSYLENQVCLFGPERYEPRYAYPLIVWLHSCGSAEQELASVMPSLSLQNYTSCAPRGTVACQEGSGLFRWGSSSASTAIAEEVVFDAIEIANREFSVAPDRIFLAGFGGGGTMAWRLGLRYPKTFAGVVSICGGFPLEQCPLCHSAFELHGTWEKTSQPVLDTHRSRFPCRLGCA